MKVIDEFQSATFLNFSIFFSTLFSWSEREKYKGKQHRFIKRRQIEMYQINRDTHFMHQNQGYQLLNDSISFYLALYSLKNKCLNSEK